MLCGLALTGSRLCHGGHNPLTEDIHISELYRAVNPVDLGLPFPFSTVFSLTWISGQSPEHSGLFSGRELRHRVYLAVYLAVRELAGVIFTLKSRFAVVEWVLLDAALF